MRKPIGRAGRTSTHPGIEPLESRHLLSSVFAHLDAGPLSAGGHESITLRLTQRDFTMPGGKALLGFSMSESGGTAGKMAMVSGGKVMVRRAGPVTGVTEMMLASVKN